MCSQTFLYHISYKFGRCTQHGFHPLNEHFWLTLTPTLAPKVGLIKIQSVKVREKLALSALKVSMNFSNSSGGRKSPIKCFPFPMSVRDSAHSGKNVKIMIKPLSTALRYLGNLEGSEWTKIVSVEGPSYPSFSPFPSGGGDVPRYLPVGPPPHRCHTRADGLSEPFPTLSASLPLHACASLSFHTFLASVNEVQEHIIQRDGGHGEDTKEIWD